MKQHPYAWYFILKYFQNSWYINSFINFNFVITEILHKIFIFHIKLHRMAFVGVLNGMNAATGWTK